MKRHTPPLVSCLLICALWVTGVVVAAEGARRQALQFDGKEDHCVVPLTAALADDLTLEVWICTTAEAKLQERIVALVGPQGALQLCISNGHFVIDNDGGPERNVVATATSNDGRWHHVVVRRYEKTTYALSLDGADAGQCPGTTPPYTALWLGTAPGKPPFHGCLDDVRLYNRCITTAEVFSNYMGERPVATAGLAGWWKLDGDVADSVGRQDGRTMGAPLWVAGRGKALFAKPRISSRFYAEPGMVSVDVDTRMMGDFPLGTAWEVTLWKPTGELAARRMVPLVTGTGGGTARTNDLGVDEFASVQGSLAGVVHLPADGLAPGEFQVKVRVMAPQGEPLGEVATDGVAVSARPAWMHGLKVLNNLVWELLDVPGGVTGDGAQFTFANPRAGWVFFASTAGAGMADGDRADMVLDSAPDNRILSAHVAGADNVQEAMRFLSAGEHHLTVTLRGKAALTRLVVRAIPELGFDEYLQNHNVIKEFPARDVAFMQRSGMLRNLNTLFVHGTHVTPPPYWREWHEAGKRWVQCMWIGDDATVDDAVERWVAPFKTEWPDGVILDEFMRFSAHRTARVAKLLADPRMKGKRFYPFTCSPVPERGGEEGAKLLRSVMAAGQLPAWERYLQEQADEGACWQMLNLSLRGEVKQHWLPMRADAMRHTMLVLGNFMSSPPETLNVQPTVDFKVWMDMQYHLIATDPLFFGLAGLMDWTSGYADEENIRWTARLYRHYAIEGRTDMLSPQYGFRFRLTHLQNPDFDAGLEGWDVTAAEPGSVDTRTFNGYGALQGRYPETSQGNCFLRMKRSARGPNTVSQTIRDLVPGRLYSLKLLSSDYGDLTAGRSEARKTGPNIRLANVEVLPRLSVDALTATKWFKGVPAFTANTPYWTTYHYRVFRASGDVARLTLSDWLSETAAGGPEGQETACNFAELQPYLEE